MKLLKFPEMRQTFNYDCGAAALEAVLAYFGIDVREDVLMKMIGTSSKLGSPVTGIIKAARKYGLKYEAHEMTIDDLKKSIDIGHPVILVIQAWTNNKHVDWDKDWADGHYVVAIGYDSKKIYFDDPSSVLRTYLTYEELEERWHDKAKSKKYFKYGIVFYGKRKSFDFEKSVHMD